MNTPLQVGARRLTADIAVQILARALNLVLGVVVTLVLVRDLGSRGFGVWSTLLAITQIASSFGDLGLDQIAIARASDDRTREADWLGALLSLRVLLAVPMTVGSIAAVLVLVGGHEDKLAGVLLSCVLLANAPTTLNVAFQLRVRNDISMGILTTNSIVWAAAAAAVVLASGTITDLAAAFLVTSALTSAGTALLALRLTPVRFAGTRQLWPALLRVGLGVGLAGILVTVYVKLDQILVFQLAGRRAAGLYGADYRVLEGIQFIPISVMTTLFPLIAAAYSTDRARVRRLLQSAAEYLTMASMPILVVTLIAAHPIIHLLFGRSYDAAAPALPVLAGAFVLTSLGYLAGNMTVILELQRDFVRYAAVGVVVNAALNLVLIPRYGFLAAAWVTLVTEATVISLALRRVRARLEMTVAWGRLARIVIATAALALVVWLARVAAFPLGALLALAAVAYPLGLIAVGALDLAEVRGVLRVRGGGGPAEDAGSQ